MPERGGRCTHEAVRRPPPRSRAGMLLLADGGVLREGFSLDVASKTRGMGGSLHEGLRRLLFLPFLECAHPRAGAVRFRLAGRARPADGGAVADRSGVDTVFRVVVLLRGGPGGEPPSESGVRRGPTGGPPGGPTGGPRSWIPPSGSSLQVRGCSDGPTPAQTYTRWVVLFTWGRAAPPQGGRHCSSGGLRKTPLPPPSLHPPPFISAFLSLFTCIDMGGGAVRRVWRSECGDRPASRGERPGIGTCP